MDYVLYTTHDCLWALFFLINPNSYMWGPPHANVPRGANMRGNPHV